MLDPSEIDRIVETTGASIPRLVDWKNRVGDPFHLRCRKDEDGTYSCDIDLTESLSVTGVVPVVHGEYEQKDEDDVLVYESKPGNTLGQMEGPDGRPAFGVAVDLTTLDAEGRPLLKVYFGTAAGWFQSNEYHAKWLALKDVKGELAPLTQEADRSKEAGRNPRSKQRQEEREGGGGGGAPVGGVGAAAAAGAVAAGAAVAAAVAAAAKAAEAVAAAAAAVVAVAKAAVAKAVPRRARAGAGAAGAAVDAVAAGGVAAVKAAGRPAGAAPAAAARAGTEAARAGAVCLSGPSWLDARPVTRLWSGWPFP